MTAVEDHSAGADSGAAENSREPSRSPIAGLNTHPIDRSDGIESSTETETNVHHCPTQWDHHPESTISHPSSTYRPPITPYLHIFSGGIALSANVG